MVPKGGRGVQVSYSWLQGSVLCTEKVLSRYELCEHETQILADCADISGCAGGGVVDLVVQLQALQLCTSTLPAPPCASSALGWAAPVQSMF